MITLLALAYASILPVQYPAQQQPQTIYVSNLSATDERDSGSYYQVTTLPQMMPIIPPDMPIENQQPINYQDQ